MKNLSTISLVAITGLFLSATGVRADTIFEQDFENGLGPSESVFGSWSINNALAALNNGTLMMGHSEDYGFAGEPVEATPSENFYAYYQVDLDLRGFENAVLTFDFVASIEQDFDGFNVIASTGVPSPPDGLLIPTPASELQYRPLTIHGESSAELGPDAWSSPVEGTVYDLDAIYDLSAFDDQKVTLRFQFGTDTLWGGIGANFDNILVDGSPLPDTDNDGMPDSWEQANGLVVGEDDSAGHLDGDGLTNLEEFELCTDPNLEDTDGDGFDDNVESNSGIWNGPEDPGTNPAKADSDGDGLGDDVETNTGTYVDENDTGSDPNNPDSDGDGFIDGEDPDPNDPSIVPSVIFGGSPFTTTHVWQAGTMNLANAIVVTADDSVAGERITAQTPFIHFHDNTAPPAFSAISRPYPLWDDDNGGAGGFGDREDFAIRSVGQINIKPPGGLVSFVVNSDDGFSLRIDGAEVGTAGDRGRADSIIDVTLDAGLHDLEFIHWERGGGAGVSVAVQRYFGGGAPPFTARNETQWELLSAFAAPEKFGITDFDYDAGTDMVTLTWNSTLGESYGVYFSTDCIDWSADLNDSVPADPGDTTSATFDLGEFGIGELSDLFFRVERN